MKSCAAASAEICPLSKLATNLDAFGIRPSACADATSARCRNVRPSSCLTSPTVASKPLTLDRIKSQICIPTYVYYITLLLVLLFSRCIPEESNEIGSQRIERSQDVSSSLSAQIPHWELLAIGALLIGILILMVFTITLARHVRRLKTRIRRSAEVLVPGGTLLGNGGYGHNGSVPYHAGATIT